MGRGGLEPPTSAVLGPERSTTETGTPYETAGVIRPAPVSATKFEERPLRGAKFDSQNHYCREAGRAVKRVFPGANCCLMYFLNPTDHIITPEVGYGQSIVLTHLCAFRLRGISAPATSRRVQTRLQPVSLGAFQTLVVG